MQLVQNEMERAVNVDRRPQETENICTETTSLLTSFRSDMQAYGVMFTVESKDTPLTILTLEFSAMITRNNEPVHIQVYTKTGDYKGYQAVPNAWSKVADQEIIPARTGRGTLIPPQSFTPVLLGANELRAFYVTLDTTNLRYTGAPGVKAGQLYVQDEAMQINVGAGLLEYPFSANLFEPRLFNGAFHYRRHVPCKDRPTIAKVPFQMLVQFDGTLDAALRQINQAVQTAMRTILENDKNLMAHMGFTGSSTEEARSDFPVEAVTDCRTNTIRQCDPVVAELELQYDPTTVDEGTIAHLLLNARGSVVETIGGLLNNMNVLYMGAIPVDTKVVMTLDGIPNGQLMDGNVQEYFEQVVLDLLAERLISSFRVLSVQINDQALLTPHTSQRTNRQRRQLTTDNRNLQFHPQTMLDVVTTVLGTYRPPPFVNFETSVLNVMNQDGGRYFRGELMARRNRPEYPLSDQERLYFDPLKSVSSRSSFGPPEAEKPSKGISRILFIILLVLVALAALMFGLYALKKYLKRRKEKKREKKKLEKKKNVAVVDDYMSRVYEQAFGNFKQDNNDAKNENGNDDDEEEVEDLNVRRETLPLQPGRQPLAPANSGYVGVQFHPSVTERQRHRITQQAPPPRTRPQLRQASSARSYNQSSRSFSTGSRDEDIVSMQTGTLR